MDRWAISYRPRPGDDGQRLHADGGAIFLKCDRRGLEQGQVILSCSDRHGLQRHRVPGVRADRRRDPDRVLVLHRAVQGAVAVLQQRDLQRLAGASARTTAKRRARRSPRSRLLPVHVQEPGSCSVRYRCIAGELSRSCDGSAGLSVRRGGVPRCRRRCRSAPPRRRRPRRSPRHSEHHAARLVLRDGARAGLVHREHAARAVVAHAGENHPDGVGGPRCCAQEWNSTSTDGRW